MNIPFIIGLIIVALTTIYASVLVLNNKNKKPRNKVRFFVMLGFNGKPCLHIKDIYGRYYPIADANDMNRFGLNAFEFVDMPFEEVKEVYIKL